MSRRSRRVREAPMSFFSFQDIISCTTGILVLITLLLTMELATRTYADVPSKQSEDELRTALNDAQAQRERLAQQVDAAKTTAASAARGPISPSRLLEAQRKAALRHDQVLATEQRLNKLDAEIATTTQKLQEAKTLAQSLSAGIARYREQLKETLKESRVVLIGGPATAKEAVLVELALEKVQVGLGRTPDERHVIQSFQGMQAIDDFLAWAPARDPAADYFVLFVRPDAAGAFDHVVDALRGKLGFEVGWDAWPVDRSLFERGF